MSNMHCTWPDCACPFVLTGKEACERIQALEAAAGYFVEAFDQYYPKGSRKNRPPFHLYAAAEQTRAALAAPSQDSEQ